MDDKKKPSEGMENDKRPLILLHCKRCNQMTNHRNGALVAECGKCGNLRAPKIPKKELNEDEKNLNSFVATIKSATYPEAREYLQARDTKRDAAHDEAMVEGLAKWMYLKDDKLSNEFKNPEFDEKWWQSTREEVKKRLRENVKEAIKKAREG